MKKVVKGLLAKLKAELLVLDWKKRQATRAAVQLAIETELDSGLPEVYDRAIYARKRQRCSSTSSRRIRGRARASTTLRE